MDDERVYINETVHQIHSPSLGCLVVAVLLGIVVDPGGRAGNRGWA